MISGGTVCGVVLIRDDGAALLQLRDDKPDIQDPGIWVFPGGHADPGEEAVDAAKREFLEETCYQVEDLRFLVSYSAQQVKCCEGQDLQFIARDAVSLLQTRSYLPGVWDLAIAASRAGVVEVGRQANESLRQARTL